ncbi:MAG: hypothetical protein QM754_09770 [Tepidisphaeraceae bacterium]
MLGLLKPCEPPVHHFGHLVSGVIVLSLLWALVVIAMHWLF